jgi:hypothetical protein
LPPISPIAPQSPGSPRIGIFDRPRNKKSLTEQQLPLITPIAILYSPGSPSIDILGRSRNQGNQFGPTKEWDIPPRPKVGRKPGRNLIPNAHSIEESTPTRPAARAQNRVAGGEPTKRLAAARVGETTQTLSTSQIAPQAGPNNPNGSIFDQQGSNNQVEQIVPSMSSIASILQLPKKRGRPILPFPQIAPQAGPSNPSKQKGRRSMNVPTRRQAYLREADLRYRARKAAAKLAKLQSGSSNPPKKIGRPPGRFSMDVPTKQQLYNREANQASRARKAAAKLAELESGLSNSSGEWRKENQVDATMQIDSFLPIASKASPSSRTSVFSGPRNMGSRLEETMQTRSTQPIALQSSPGSSRILRKRKTRVWDTMEPTPPQVLSLPNSKDRIEETVQIHSIPPIALHPGLSSPHVGYVNRPKSQESDLEGTTQNSSMPAFTFQSSPGCPRVGIFDQSPNKIDRIEETLQTRSSPPIELQLGPVSSHVGYFDRPASKENQREALQTRTLPPNELLIGPGSPSTGHPDGSHDKENQMKGTRKTRSSAQAKAINFLTSRPVAQSNVSSKQNVSFIYII